jgi:CheY-like chemotaxis protein
MGSATILVIDDELHIRQFLRAAFEFEGFTVQEAHDAEEGIRSATLKPPDLIILDLGLPDRDGATIIERLRAWSKTPDRTGNRLSVGAIAVAPNLFSASASRASARYCCQLTHLKSTTEQAIV